MHYVQSSAPLESFLYSLIIHVNTRFVADLQCLRIIDPALELIMLHSMGINGFHEEKNARIFHETLMLIFVVIKPL